MMQSAPIKFEVSTLWFNVLRVVVFCVYEQLETWPGPNKHDHHFTAEQHDS